MQFYLNCLTKGGFLKSIFLFILISSYALPTFSQDRAQEDISPEESKAEIAQKINELRAKKNKQAVEAANPGQAVNPTSKDKPKTAASDNSPGADASQGQTANSAEINVKNADIAAILRIFSRKTGRNYILDERVKGKVTMYLPGTIPPSESLKILDSVLALKGFTAVPIGDNLWKVIPSKEAKQSTIPTVRDAEDLPGAAVVTRLINLKFVSAEEVQQLVSQIISGDGFVNAYPGTNSLVIIDYEDNIARITGIIEDLDLPFKNREMVIIPVKNADAMDIAEKIKELMGDGSKKDSGGGDSRFQNFLTAQANALSAVNAANRAANSNNAPTQGSIPPGPNSTAGSQGNAGLRSRSTEPKITADERTNSIIVVGDEDSILRIKALVSQLDTTVDLSSNRFYVYRCQHANAEELSDVLSGLVGGEGGSSGSSRNRDRNRGNSFGVSNNSDDSNDIFGGGLSGRGLQGRNSRGSRTNNRLSGTSRRPGSSRNEGNQQSGPATVQLGENFSITADPATNSLIIQAAKADYEKVKELLRQLDIKRRQVLVEAALLEVTIEDGATLSTDFLGSGGGSDGGFIANSNFTGNLAKILTNPTSLSNFTLAAASAGSLTIGGGSSKITIPTQSVIINAAKSNSNINVLSSPTLLATDNEEAEIVVGRNIPFLSSTSSNLANIDSNNVFNQIDRQDVGITLRITPQISSQDYVTLKIFTDVSDVVDTADDRLGPTTSVRSSETTVITKDSQMIVIGGLIRDSNQDTVNGVPFLQDVPVLGQAFRSTGSKKMRQNLLTFITPRIIKDQFDARDSTRDYRDTAKKIIDVSNSQPDRDELLDSVNIDKVAEQDETEVKKPGTILAPKNSGGTLPGKLSGNRVPDNVEVTTYNDNQSNEAIELKIEPQGSKPSQPAIKENTDAGAMLPSNAKELVATAYYIILKPAFPAMLKDSGDSLPFSLSDKGVVGLTIPPTDQESVANFFKVGSVYTYELGDKKIPFKVTEIHQAVMPSEKTTGLTKNEWYPLSAYELLSLGQGPWERK